MILPNGIIETKIVKTAIILNITLAILKCLVHNNIIAAMNNKTKKLPGIINFHNILDK